MSQLSRRQGGRAARQALRAAPLAQDLRPIRPGLSGGSYGPLSEADQLAIHRAALKALEEIGLADAPQSGIEILTGLPAGEMDSECNYPSDSLNGKVANRLQELADLREEYDRPAAPTREKPDKDG